MKSNKLCFHRTIWYDNFKYTFNLCCQIHDTLRNNEAQVICAMTQYQTCSLHNLLAIYLQVCLKINENVNSVKSKKWPNTPHLGLYEWLDCCFLSSYSLSLAWSFLLLGKIKIPNPRVISTFWQHLMKSEDPFLIPSPKAFNTNQNTITPLLKYPITVHGIWFPRL